MSMVSLSLLRAFAIGTVLLLATAGTAVAQAPAPAPLAYPVPQLTLAEARAIIEGAIAYARESNVRMAVAVVDWHNTLGAASWDYGGRDAPSTALSRRHRPQPARYAS